MPRKKSEPKALLPAQTLERLWDAIDWYAVASDARPEYRFIKDKAHIKGLCIYHSEASVSFYITPSKRIAKCFGCDCFITNPVRLYADLLKISYADTLSVLKGNPATRKFIPKSFVEQSEKTEKHQTLKAKVVGFCCDLLSQFVAMPAEELANTASWAMSTVDWLKERIPVDNALPQLAANRHIGILPPLAYFKEDFTLCQDPEAVAFATEYFRDNIVDKHDHIGALMLITQTDPNTIERVKLRKREWDNPKTIFVKDAFSEGEPTGFLGLNFYRAFLGVRRPSNLDAVEPIAYITEGEFDTLHAMAHHLETYEYISLSAGGGSASASNVDRLADLGITTVCIVPDADKGGRNFAQRLLSRIKAKGLGIKIFEWPSNYLAWTSPDDPEKRIKDPDEAIRFFGYDAWARDLRAKENWREPYEWALEQLEHGLARFDDPSLHERTQAAKTAGGCLNQPQECRQYCKLVAQRYGLDEAALYREIRVQYEDAAGFVERVKEALLERYSIIGFEHASNRLHLWDPVHRLELEIPLDKKPTAVARLAHGIGSILTFIQERVGEPTYAVDGDEAVASSTPSNSIAALHQKNYEDVLMRAFESMTRNCPLMGEHPRLRQGFHYRPDSQRGHLANGRDLWRLEWESGTVSAIKMPGPSDGSVLFDLSRADPWLDLHGPEDITKLRIDLGAIYETILKMLQVGWRFTHQEVDCQFLAAYIMSLPVADIFPRQTSIRFTGSASSGKSSIVAGLIAGWQIPAIRLVAASHGYANLTRAALYQHTGGISHVVCLDEFENDGSNDPRSRTQSSILKNLNDQITSRSGSKTVIGTADGKGHTFETRYPVIFAGINPFTDEASATRYVIFEMAKEKLNRRQGDIQQALMLHWSVDTFTKIRHELSLGMYHYVPQLLDAYRVVGQEIEPVDVLPSFIPSRFKEGLLSVLATMKVIGLDHLAFAKDFCRTREGHVVRAHGAGLSNSLFHDLLNAPITLRDEKTTTTTIGRMLNNIGDLDAINRSHCGIYIDINKRWLVVNWLQVHVTVLRDLMNYRDRQPADLAEYARLSPQFIPEDQVEKFDVFKRLSDYIGYTIKRSNYSVFTAEDEIDLAIKADADRRRARPAKNATGPQALSIAATAETVESGSEGESV